MLKFKKITIILIVLLMTVCATNVFSSQFPEKNIDFIVGYGAGGGNDIITRALAPIMKDLMGVEVIVANISGASGSIAAQKIASMEPAYAISLYSKSLVLIQYTGYGQISIYDFTPVAQIVEDTAALSVASDAPYDTLSEFIDYIRDHPGEVTIANGGAGALWHLCAAQLTKVANLDVKHIPYPGGAPAVVATAAHEVDAVIVNPAETRSLVETGDLKFLAVMSDKRLPAYPDVPTALESGLDFTFPVWRGIFTAAGGSEETIEQLADYIRQATENESFIEFMETVGISIRYRGPKEFAELVEKEDKLYSELLEDLGLKVSEPKR